MPSLPDVTLAKVQRGSAERNLLHAARLDRVAAVGRRGRRHDRAPPPLQLRTGGARRCQHRLRPVRRHLRHRHDRAHGDQRARGRARARSPACCMRCSCCCFMLIAAPLASFIPLASLAGVLAVVAWNMVEKHAFAMLVRAHRRRCGGAARDLPADDLPRPDRGDRRRLRARLGAVHPPHVARRPRSKTHTPFVAEDSGGRATATARPTTRPARRIRMSSSIASPAPSSSAPPPRSARCSTASPTRIGR